MQKPKSLHDIEQRMERLDPQSLRYQVLDCAKDFKSSWMRLGQHLYSVHKDRLYKDWGYLTFEAYSSKEIGIRQPTAVKLLKSYSFLEREEPQYLKSGSFEEKKPSTMPDFEAVNALRLVKESNKVAPAEYRALREDVLDKGSETAEVKKKIRYILKKSAGHDEKSASEKKSALVKRLVLSLRNTRAEMRELSFPSKVQKELDELLESLEEMMG